MITEEQIDQMANRFLCWKLPSDFSPDGGVMFVPSHTTPSSPLWPTGTNLLTATQAKAMLEHVLDVPNAEASSGVTNYKRMFEDAVRTLAAIDEALGIGDDGCADPEQTLDAVAYLKAAAARGTELARTVMADNVGKG